MQNPSSHQGKVRAHAFISGIVQGVSYRYYTVNRAKQVGVSGWVRNLPDSRVEAVFEGTQEQVETMIRWCQQGSPASVVERVVFEYEQPQGIEGFVTKR
jgi:acylphosphatase